jgi:hypothetical protein
MICAARMAAVHHSPHALSLSIWSGWHLQHFGDNYVADNSDGDAAAGPETNSRTGSLDALRIFLDIC